MNLAWKDEWDLSVFDGHYHPISISECARRGVEIAKKVQSA